MPFLLYVSPAVCSFNQPRLYMSGIGFALMTVSFRRAKYAFSSSIRFRLSLTSRCRSRTAIRLWTALSNRFLSSARAFDALPGVFPTSGIVLVMPDEVGIPFMGRSNSARRACRLEARSVGLTMIRSPAEEDPFPGGGRRARADEAKEDEADGRVGLCTGSGRRTGLPARDAVLETKALLGRVRGTNPAGSRDGAAAGGRYGASDKGPRCNGLLR